MWNTRGAGQANAHVASACCMHDLHIHHGPCTHSLVRVKRMVPCQEGSLHNSKVQLHGVYTPGQSTGTSYEILLLLIPCRNWVHDPIALGSFMKHLLSSVTEHMGFEHQRKAVYSSSNRFTCTPLVQHQEGSEHPCHFKRRLFRNPKP